MEAYVYILHCADGRFYVGSTRESLEHRIAEHNTGSYGVTQSHGGQLSWCGRRISRTLRTPLPPNGN
jgi:predicted GIY-YIG superfamily endonuclease